MPVERRETGRLRGVRDPVILTPRAHSLAFFGEIGIVLRVLAVLPPLQGTVVPIEWLGWQASQRTHAAHVGPLASCLGFAAGCKVDGVRCLGWLRGGGSLHEHIS